MSRTTAAAASASSGSLRIGRRRDLIPQLRHLHLRGIAGAVRLRMRAHHRVVHRRQLRAGVVYGRVRGEPAEQLRHPMRPVRLHRRFEMMRTRHHVRDDFRVGRVRHRRFEHADDRGGVRTDTDRASDHGRIALERGRPEAVGQDRGADPNQCWVFEKPGASFRRSCLLTAEWLPEAALALSRPIPRARIAKAVALLVAHGADVKAPSHITSHNPAATTPLAYALAHKLDDVAEILRAHGAKD